jgi:hypothetical protein
MTPYIQASEVVTLPGRLSELWGRLDVPEQDHQLALATAEANRITGQDGGLWTQTGKQVLLQIRTGGNRLVLPNLPIGAVSGIRVMVPAPVRHVDPFDIPIGTWALPGDQTVLVTPDTTSDPPPRPYGRVFVPGDIVRVTYTCGLVAEGGQLPDAIRQATRLLLSELLFLPIDNPAGAEELSGAESERYPARPFPPGALDLFDPTVVAPRPLQAGAGELYAEAVDLLSPWTCRTQPA